MPTIIPLIAPNLFMRFEKIPMVIAGKNDAAASPNAKATTCATKPGRFIPKNPATHTAIPAAMRAAINSPFSLMVGMSFFLNRSCATDVEITSSSPAAVESAAANPVRQLGNFGTGKYHDVSVYC